MAANRSRKRSTPFVPKFERDLQAKERAAVAPHPRADLDAAARELSKPITVRTPQISLPAHRHPHPVRSPRRGIPKGPALMIGGGLAATAGTAYLIRRKGKQTMKKNIELIDPFAKAYPIVEPVPGAVRVPALLPTGRNVGQANNLKRVGGTRKVGPEPGLRRYTTKPRGQQQGPFGKGFQPSVERGLKMAAEARGTMPLRTPGGLKPPGPLEGALSRRDPKVNSKIPDASRRGRRLA